MTKYEKIVASPKGIFEITVRRISRWFDEIEISYINQNLQPITIYKSPRFSPFGTRFTVFMVKLAELFAL